ncbi:MAG TPA: hypothetical protein VNZ26_14360 [Vicinamibacterales bacterium]|nr:hypothetical protein [Vicinamibacterales bacterium]
MLRGNMSYAPAPGTARTRRLRMGMVGGGLGSFVGGVHRLAAVLDGDIELVAGVFSRDWDNTKATGARRISTPAA